MASSFLTKLLGGLKSFLKNMTSPLGGFSVDDAKMNVKDGEYSVLYEFGTSAIKDESGEDISNVKGEKIPLNLLLSTVNVKDALAPLLKGLNDMGTLKEGNPREFSNLMFLMLGDDKFDYTKSDEYKRELYEKAKEQASYEDSASNISDDLQSVMAADLNEAVVIARNSGKGLLGIQLDNDNALPSNAIAFDGTQWSWEKIAGDYIKYALECQVPDKDYGAISNVSLSECAKLIPEYLTRTNTITNAGEVNVDLTRLVKPLLIRIQADLGEYFTDAYNKNIEKKTTAEKEAEANAQKESEEQPAEETEQPTEETEQPITEENPVEQSRQIKVTLKKIQGSTDFDLLGLQSNYNPMETLDDLDDIISQEEFIDALTEDPQTFAVVVDDDGYDIEQCETCEIDPCASLCEVFKAGIRAYRNLYILHWMSHGNDMMKLHLLTEDMYKELIEEIDTIGELLVEKQGTVPQLDFPCDYVPVQQYDFQTGLDQIKSLIQMYIDCIDYAYPNQTSDVQSTLDEWIRYWNKQLNYFVKGQEV